MVDRIFFTRFCVDRGSWTLDNRPLQHVLYCMYQSAPNRQYTEELQYHWAWDICWDHGHCWHLFFCYKLAKARHSQPILLFPKVQKKNGFQVWIEWQSLSLYLVTRNQRTRMTSFATVIHELEFVGNLFVAIYAQHIQTVILGTIMHWTLTFTASTAPHTRYCPYSHNTTPILHGQGRSVTSSNHRL